SLVDHEHFYLVDDYSRVTWLYLQNSWANAVSTACFLINRKPSADTQPNITKLDPKSLKCVLLGYSRIQKGYRCYSPQLHCYLISSDVTFHEDLPYFPVTTYRHQEKNDDMRPRIISDLIREPSSQLKDVPIDAPNNVSNEIPISALNKAYSNSDAPSDARGGSDLPPPSFAPELDLPIASRKGKPTCTYPISAFVSYDGSSTSSCAFVANLES
ncbi:retrovirus-related pol polyprotein from transposon TNT 1-94, partial [Tanacetum coccineum]